MKLMIAGDIHGSALYCEKLLDLFKKSSADKLVLTGDILYHGPRNDLPEGHAPKKVIALLNAIADKILSVRGNCEAEVDSMVLDFAVTADYIVVDTGVNTFYVSHGHIYNPDSPGPFAKGAVLVNGHTHVPVFEKYPDFTYINVGSVSIPKENSPHSAVVIDGNKVDFYDLDGNIYKSCQL